MNGEVSNKIWKLRLEDNPRFHISVDCVIFGYENGSLKVLLMESDIPQYRGMLSLVGTLLQQDQTLRAAAKNVLFDSTGLDDVYLEQVEAFSSLDRHPFGRVLTIAYFSLIIISQYKIKDQTGNSLRWVPVSELGDMAFDHREIVDKCFSILQKKLRESPIGFNLLPQKFTIQELQGLYETILEMDLDKRNFRRKLNSLEILIDANEIQESVSHRPAKLYRFNHDKYYEKQKLGASFEL